MKAFWASLALLALVGLAGCAHSAPQSQASETSPCDMPMGWSFGGPCASGTVSRTGTRVIAPPYHGMRIEVDFGPADSDGAAFVVAIATGAGDISGRLNNAVPFPRYGKVPCTTVGRAVIPCDGRALFYLLVVDATQAVTFSRGASLRVVRDKPFPSGSRCHWNALVPDPAAPAGVVYVRHAPTAVPRGSILLLGPTPGTQNYGGGGHVVAFAISCSP